MTIVPIYAANGKETGRLTVHGDLEFVSGRTSRVGDTYFKGLGTAYRSHLTLDPHEDGVMEKNAVFYCGFNAASPLFVGKFGIFQRRYQPYFSDFIGACGPKELRILDNSRDFGPSAVTVVGWEEYDRKHHQYYFALKYKTGRTDFLRGGDGDALNWLLRYMAVDGWCFPWDKTSIRDITEDGMVHDVADMFRSHELVHLFGSAYSVFYSLATCAHGQFRELCGDQTPIQAARGFLCGLGVQVPDSGDDIADYLLPGRNCAHVENIAIGDAVREEYFRLYRRRCQCLVA